MEMQWDDLRLFLRVAEHGSLSAAARALRLGQATLSRRMATFEEQLGAPLLVRDSQGIRLTPLGERLLPAVQHMAEWAAEAGVQPTLEQRGMQGKVRIAAPPGVAYDLLAPLVVPIRKAHPGLQLELLSAVRLLNLARGEADLALRTVAPTDPDLVCLDRMEVRIRVYASADYARQLPPGYTVDDLDWIAWAAPFDEGETNQAIRALSPNYRTALASDDHNVQLAACRAGAGAMLLPDLRPRQTALGALVPLTIDLGRGAVRELFVVCHKRTANLSTVRAVHGFIAEELAWMRQAAAHPTPPAAP